MDGQFLGNLLLVVIRYRRTANLDEVLVFYHPVRGNISFSKNLLHCKRRPKYHLEELYDKEKAYCIKPV